MNTIKLYQRLALLFFTAAVTACSNKIINTGLKADEKLPEIIAADSLYIPAACIIVPDNKAKTNKEDELYYDDEYGYRYWRYNDGKYYLDQKYNKTLLLKKKAAAVPVATKTMWQ
jgi:hypothetical protein